MMAEEPYFVDFLRDPPEPTGEEADDAVLEAPKIYELVNKCGTIFVCLLFFISLFEMLWGYCDSSSFCGYVMYV